VRGQRRASFLPPFADASHMGASAEMDGIAIALMSPPAE
jgi:hypothetical protein